MTSAYASFNTPNSYEIRRLTGELVDAIVVGCTTPLPQPDPTVATRNRKYTSFIIQTDEDTVSVQADGQGGWTLNGEPVTISLRGDLITSTPI
ncbi:hypothetical protein GCM10027089_10200 [Nocardia thraciensis]